MMLWLILTPLTVLAVSPRSWLPTYLQVLPLRPGPVALVGHMGYRTQSTSSQHLVLGQFQTPPWRSMSPSWPCQCFASFICISLELLFGLGPTSWYGALAMAPDRPCYLAGDWASRSDCTSGTASGHQRGRGLEEDFLLSEWHETFEVYEHHDEWLVVLNLAIFPSSPGMLNPNWLILLGYVETTNQVTWVIFSFTFSAHSRERRLKLVGPFWVWGLMVLFDSSIASIILGFWQCSCSFLHLCWKDVGMSQILSNSKPLST